MLRILSTKTWNSLKAHRRKSLFFFNSLKLSHHPCLQFDQSSSGSSPKPLTFFHPLPFRLNDRIFSYGYSSNLGNSEKSCRNFGGYLENPSFLGSKRSFCSGIDRESMEYDVVIVGAGPAGLSAAIRLKQLCIEKDVDISVCVVEKGAEVGAHILSGNVFEARALDELIPKWKQEQAPVDTPVSSDKFWFLTSNRALSLPSPFENKGNYVISLSQLVRWMAMKAEELGVEIYPGFAASEGGLHFFQRVVEDHYQRK